MEINVIYGLHCAQVCACKINAHKKINDIRLWMGNNIARTCVHISPLSAISFPHFKCFKFKNKNRKTHTHTEKVYQAHSQILNGNYHFLIIIYLTRRSGIIS